MTDTTTEPTVETEEGVNQGHTPEEGYETPTPEGSADLADPEEGVRTADTPEDEGSDPDTFPRSVVEKLRKENATYREKAKKAEDYARELFYARVAATGRLADADDLPFDADLLEDHDALLGAVEELLTRKPHLGSRKPRGDVGQGLSGSSATVDLAGLLRSRA